MKQTLLPAFLPLCICVVLGVSCVKQPAKLKASGTPDGTSSVYWTYAEDTHNYVVGNLLTSYNSYRVDSANPNEAYEWYNASQVYADAAMVLYGDSRYAPYMNNTYTWLGNLWNTGSASGGYYAAAGISGSGAGGDQYVDDNALTGNAYLDCYAVTSGTTQTNYLNSAEAIANWLMTSGQWDTTYGGGFWWNTEKQVKPTQSNGLAMQLFLRLYKITGQSYYQEWAVSVKDWLESEMYNSTSGLYIWEVTDTGKQNVYFTYDNAIMTEADLLYDQVVGDTSYLSKAEAVAGSMNSLLWNPTYQVYIFNSTDPRVNPTWCGWASQAMIRLYQADGNANWLNYAQQNIDYINANLRDTVNDGYYQFCALNGTGRYTNMEGVDQAWMQRVQAQLSNYR